MSKFVVGPASDHFTDLLFAAGVVEEKPENVRRIVLDLQVGHAAMIYIEKYADDENLIAGLHAAIDVRESA